MALDSRGSVTYAGLAADDTGHSDARPPLVLLHGLTFDRQMWRPALTELETIDAGRRAIAIDLPGHGDSPDAASYVLEAVVERIHEAVVDAGLEAPVLVGHSAAASIAFVYGITHPASGVVAVEGTMRVGAFAGMAQSIAPMLRGPGFDQAWNMIATRTFGLDEVAPDVRTFVAATSRPRQEIVLGYWQEVLERSPQELDAMVAGGAASIRASGLQFVAVVGHEPSAEDADWIRLNMPGSRTEVWSDSGHFPHLAHPRRFAMLLAETGTWAMGNEATVAASSGSI